MSANKAEMLMVEAFPLKQQGEHQIRQLIEKLRVKYPGAAAELEEGIELALVVPGLPLPTALKQQVQGIGCVRMAFRKAIGHTDGSLPPLKRVESGLGRIRTRRAVGYRDLPELAKILEPVGVVEKGRFEDRFDHD